MAVSVQLAGVQETTEAVSGQREDIAVQPPRKVGGSQPMAFVAAVVPALRIVQQREQQHELEVRIGVQVETRVAARAQCAAP
jgi:hypothetical protein